jgi:hypothetical protein
MMVDNLTSDNLIIYAMKEYRNPSCLISEFKHDMKHFNYLKRLFFKYVNYDEIRERLIINHLVVIYNLFGNVASTRMLFFKIDKKYYSVLKTYLVFLNYMPEIVRGINGKDILSSDIPIDLKMVNILRKIKCQ